MHVIHHPLKENHVLLAEGIYEAIAQINWKPRHLSQRRAEDANEETIQNFLRSGKALLEANLRLWNCDESGFV